MIHLYPAFDYIHPSDMKIGQYGIIDQTCQCNGDIVLRIGSVSTDIVYNDDHITLVSLNNPDSVWVFRKDSKFKIRPIPKHSTIKITIE